MAAFAVFRNIVLLIFVMVSSFGAGLGGYWVYKKISASISAKK